MNNNNKTNQTNHFGHSWTWIPDVGAFQPALAIIFHVESEFAIKTRS